MEQKKRAPEELQELIRPKGKRVIRRTRRRTVWTRVLAIVVIGLLFIPIIWTVSRHLHNLHVDLLIKKHRANPTQETADGLCELLNDSSVPPEKGNKILVMLISPEIITRETYAAGKPLYVAVTRPFDLRFFDMGGSFLHRHRVGEYQGPWSGGGGVYTTVLHRKQFGAVLALPAAISTQQTGALDATLDFRLQLWPDTRKKRWVWPSRRGGVWSLIPERVRVPAAAGRPLPQPHYEATVSVPLQLTVLADGAETITLRSNRELDTAMRKAFKVRRRSYTCDSGNRSIVIDVVNTSIEHAALPENVGFRAVYRNGTGTVAPLPGFKAHLRAGEPWPPLPFPTFHLLDTLKPGTYSGSIIYLPDADAAYEDPAIKTIWGGTLEIPVKFTITGPPVPKPATQKATE